MFNKQELVIILEALSTTSVSYGRIIRENDFSCKEERDSLENEVVEIKKLRKKVMNMIAE